MDTTGIESRLRNLEGQFQTLNQQKAEHEKSASDIEAELFRLQGRYAELQELLKTPLTDIAKATIIEGEPKKEKEVKNATTS